MEAFNMEMENLICLSLGGSGGGGGTADPELDVLIEEHISIGEELNGLLNNDALW
jgi:hypothetical protein